MFVNRSTELSRRKFLQRSSQLALAGTATSYALGLNQLSEVAAQTAMGDYKALVCIFMDGGNDHANTLIPYDPDNHAKYFAIRQGINPSTGTEVGFRRAALASTVLSPREPQTLTDDITFALSPWMPRLKQRFDEGKLAAILNVGPLEAPLTKSQYLSDDIQRFPRPAHLFSHNDQRATWQTSRPEGARTGWGGRIADLMQAANSNAMFTAISVDGTGAFLRGDQVVPYRISPRGAARFDGLRFGVQNSATAQNALHRLLEATSPDVLRADYSTIHSRSIEYGAFVHDVLGSTRISTDFGSGNDLADQLSVVARLIAARNEMSVKRQVFFVRFNGFDNHGSLDQHQKLLGEVDFAMDRFYQAMFELGLADNVTTFTASDFGRTLSLNGGGSDHGWGGHHFVLGGEVNGGQFYGVAPHVSLETDDQIGRGRLLPTTSVDEYSATLAKWLGVPPSDLPSIQPNIGRFAKADLGFMRT